MAIIKLNPMYQSIGGRLGNIVLYNRYDREYARVFVKPVNPNTMEQKKIRRTFGDAVRSWQELSGEVKHKYNMKARRLPMSGYNLYISHYIKENILHADLKKDNTSLFIASSRLSHSTQKAHPSVATPFFIKDCFYSPPVQVIYGSDIR